MNRMSASKNQLDPSLPVAVPCMSAAATVPLKSVIVDISNPTTGGSTCTSGFTGTGAPVVRLSPPGIGFGADVDFDQAGAVRRRLIPARLAVVAPTNRRRDIVPPISPSL